MPLPLDFVSQQGPLLRSQASQLLRSQPCLGNQLRKALGCSEKAAQALVNFGTIAHAQLVPNPELGAQAADFGPTQRLAHRLTIGRQQQHASTQRLFMNHGQRRHHTKWLTQSRGRWRLSA